MVQSCKHQLKHKIRECVEYIDQSTWSKYTVGMMIRILHVLIVILTILLCAAPLPLFLMNFVFMLIISGLFILLDGCFLTKLELALCQDNFTIIDPVLYLLDVEVTSGNRIRITQIGLLIYMVAMMGIYTRFKHEPS